MKKIIKMILDIILDYIYPKNIKCIACQNPIPKNNTYSLCKQCFESIIFIKNSCQKCGKHLPLFYKEEKCPYCLKKEYPFYSAISCIVYDDTAYKIINRFKYKDKTYIGEYISSIMKEKLEYENIDNFEYILPVPIHKKKRLKRGYNQSEIIAKILSKMLNKKYINPVDRIKNTKPLYGLTRLERVKELKNSFKENENISIIANKNVLLVDDIFTSGSTVSTISNILIKYRVNKVYVISFASGVNIT